MYRKLRRRRQFLEALVNVQESSLLEIGAYDMPMYDKADADIYYLDWFDTDELRAMASKSSKKDAANVCPVDFPVKAKHFAAQIPRTFDLVIANHVIEHVPDVISWLREIEQLLNPGGALFLSIPDRRYTFDYIRRESSIADILRAYRLDLEKPDAHQIFDHIYNMRPLTRKNFRDDSFKEIARQKQHTVESALKRSIALEAEYFNVHCTVYTHATFVPLMEEIKESKLVNLSLAASQDVLANDNEFHVLLRKDSP